MNQIFSFKRFSLLVVKHWADNKKRYGLSVLALAGLLLIWFVLTLLLGGDERMSEDLQQTTYFFALFAVGTFYASQYFRDLGSRSKGINFLLVPASSFEKLLCGLLYTVLLFFIVFTAIFYVVDSLMVPLSNSLFGTFGKARLYNVFTTVLIQYQDGSIIYLLVVFFAIQSAFLLGSVYFKKYNFTKTIIGIFAIFFVFVFLLYVFHEQIFPQDDQLVTLPGWVWQVFSLVMYLIAPLFWIVAYQRLKTKQV